MKQHIASFTTLTPTQKVNELEYSGFPGLYDYAELLFDAETFSTEYEQHEVWDFIPPKTFFQRITSRYTTIKKEVLHTHLLDDDSFCGEAKVQPRLAVEAFRDAVSDMLDLHMQQCYPIGCGRADEAVYVTKQEGRCLTRKHTGVGEPEHDLVSRDDEEEESTLFEYDGGLFETTGAPFLPGIEYLASIDVRSTLVQYDESGEEVDRDLGTRLFLDGYRDGEGAYLNRKPNNRPRSPGENILLVANEDAFGFSVQRPTAQSIFDTIEDVVTADGDVFDDHDAETKGFTEQQCEHAAVAYRVSRSSRLSSSVVSAAWDNNDEAGILLDTYTTYGHQIYTSQSFQLYYVDTDTQRCIGYTALNQLLHSDKDQQVRYE
jgi:hypothetical protein